jgi:hypothetical protein
MNKDVDPEAPAPTPPKDPAAVELGRKGGQAKSDRKAKAARLNIRKAHEARRRKAAARRKARRLP